MIANCNKLKYYKYVIIMTSMTLLMYEDPGKRIYHALQLISKPSQYEVLHSEALIALVIRKEHLQVEYKCTATISTNIHGHIIDPTALTYDL